MGLASDRLAHVETSPASGPLVPRANLPIAQRQSRICIMDSLVIENVSHWFGETRVLNDINLRIEAGQIVAVVGPSGCGKSTLLKAILGTHPTNEGNDQSGWHSITAPIEMWAWSINITRSTTFLRPKKMSLSDLKSMKPVCPIAGSLGPAWRKKATRTPGARSRVPETCQLTGCGETLSIGFIWWDATTRSHRARHDSQAENSSARRAVWRLR